MTQRLWTLAESWPMFLAMCVSLMVWAGTHLVRPHEARASQGGEQRSTQAAEGPVAHRID